MDREPMRKKENPMKSLVILPILTLVAFFALEQAPSPKASASSPAKSVGLFAYPMKQQVPEQQLKDENDCYSSGKQETGVDPQAPPPAAPSAEEQQAAQKQAAQQAGAATPKGGAVKGSAKGAAGGAAIGAIAGDAGTGAAIGATTGAVRGVGASRKKAQQGAQQQAADQTAQAQQQAQADANAKHQGALDTFKRAFWACMEARGYSVKRCWRQQYDEPRTGT